MRCLPEFSSRGPQAERIEPALDICPLTSICGLCVMCKLPTNKLIQIKCNKTTTRAHTHTRSVNSGSPGNKPAQDLAHDISLPPQRVREPVDSGTAPASALSGGMIRRPFSGTLLLPPLSSRLASSGEAESDARVVFTIGTRGIKRSQDPTQSR